MQRYEIILWDVDQTLLDFTRSEDYALRNTFEQFGRQIDSETVALYSGINDSYWKRLERGEVTKQEVLLGRFYTLFERLSIEDIDVREFASAYQKALGSVYFYRDDSYRLCLELKKDYRQYVVTNGVTCTQRSKLRLSGFIRKSQMFMIMMPSSFWYMGVGWPEMINFLKPSLIFRSELIS